MIYDDTCAGRPLGPVRLPGLTSSWIAGALLYRGLGRLDHTRGFSNWPSALAWLADVGTGAPIDEVQYWGHGKWGRVLMNRTFLDAGDLRTTGAHRAALERVRARMHSRSLWWFRTCETFGARAGQQFAQTWTDFFGCDAAGHTYIIGPWQSGLHRLSPGDAPSWSDDEAIIEGTSRAPERAKWSGPREPNTITCLGGKVPSSFSPSSSR